MSDTQPLYKINVQHPTSPEELADFVDLLGDEGYHVTTDLGSGRLEVRHEDDVDEDGGSA